MSRPTDSPATPPHPAANQETRLPVHSLPQSAAADLDLNPELYDDDDDGDDKMAKDDAGGGNNDDENFEDFEDVKIDLQSYSIPFDTAYEILKLDFDRKSPNNASELQQSKFVNYVDGELLQIQRKFIKNIANMDNIEIYSIFQLAQDLNQVIDLLWYSIDNRSKLFGQDHYLIKIVHDLEDYVSHYDLHHLIEINSPTLLSKENNIKFLKLFTFLQSLDVRLSFLIDGYTLEGTTKVEKISSTELVRLLSITSRLRMMIISKIDPIRLKLNKVASETSNTSSRQAQDLLNLFEVEIGRLFEGILDRSSI